MSARGRWRSGPVAIVGAGRAGLALGGALRRAGCPLAGVVARRASSARRVRRLLRLPAAATTAAGAIGPARIVLLCVPDDALRDAAAALARFPMRGKIVLHVSGAQGIAPLAILRRRGARVGTMHPLYSFPPAGAPAPSLREVSFAVDGDRAALSAARALVRALGGHSLRLTAGRRGAYHLAASIVANDLVALLDLGLDLAARRLAIGQDAAARALLPLARSSLENVARFGSRRGLTGPAARGDVRTLRAHRAALAREPAQLGALHRLLSLHAVAMSRALGRLDARTATALRRLLRSGRRR